MNLPRGLGAYVYLSPNLESARAQAGGVVQCQQVARVGAAGSANRAETAASLARLPRPGPVVGSGGSRNLGL